MVFGLGVRVLCCVENEEDEGLEEREKKNNFVKALFPNLY
jgi:hypothetical protein